MPKSLRRTRRKKQHAGMLARRVATRVATGVARQVATGVATNPSLLATINPPWPATTSMVHAAPSMAHDALSMAKINSQLGEIKALVTPPPSMPPTNDIQNNSEFVVRLPPPKRTQKNKQKKNAVVESPENRAQRNKEYNKIVEEIHTEKLQQAQATLKKQVAVEEVKAAFEDMVEDGIEEAGIVMNAEDAQLYQARKNNKKKEINKRMNTLVKQELRQITGTGVEPVFITNMMAKIESLVPRYKNAAELFEVVRTFSPYGFIMNSYIRQIRTRLQPNGTTIARGRFIHGEQAIKNVNVTGYTKLLENGLHVILEHSRYSDVKRILEVFTPELLSEFKIAMMIVFRTNPIDAHIIFELVLVQVIGSISSIRDTLSVRELFRRIISEMHGVNPRDGVIEVLKDIHDKQISAALANVVNESRKLHSFTGKILYVFIRRLLQIGAGGVVLFLLSYMGISSKDDLQRVIQDIAITPNGNRRTIAEIIDEIQRIATQYNSVTSPSATSSSDNPPDVLIKNIPKDITQQSYIQLTVHAWTKYIYDMIMWICGFNPNLYTNRQKFSLAAQGRFNELLMLLGPFILAGLRNYGGPGAAASAAVP